MKRMVFYVFDITERIILFFSAKSDYAQSKKPAVPASNSLRSRRRGSPMSRNTRRCSRLLIGCFTQNYAVNESGAESRGKENEEMGAHVCEANCVVSRSETDASGKT